MTITATWRFPGEAVGPSCLRRPYLGVACQLTYGRRSGSPTAAVEAADGFSGRRGPPDRSARPAENGSEPRGKTDADLRTRYHRPIDTVILCAPIATPSST